MPYDFCTRLTAKIRRLGYPRRNAERLARFLIVQVMLIDGVLDVPGVSGVPDVPDVPARTLWERIYGLENPAAEPFDALTLPAAYGIHR
jgi:hypothetical protein